MRLRIIAGVVVKPHLPIAEGAEGLAIGLNDIRDKHEWRIKFTSGRFAGRASANGHLAEDFSCAQLARLIQILIPSNNDNVVVEGASDRDASGFVEGLGEVHAADFSPEDGMKFRDTQCFPLYRCPAIISLADCCRLI